MYSIFFFPLISACFQTSEDSAKQNLNEGSIVIEMREFDFGDVTILSNMETSREIEIQNDGTGDLQIEDIYLSDTTMPFHIQPLSNTTILSGQSETLIVTFSPMERSDFTTELFVSSNDPTNNIIDISLTGVGVAPLIELDFDTTDLGTVLVGCERAARLGILNKGSQELVISELSYISNNIEFETSHLDEVILQLPLQIPPETGFNFFPINLDYVAYDENEDEITIVIYSNDPISPETTITFTASGVITEQITDSYVQDDKGKTDILVAVDRSTSMEDEWTGFISNFDLFTSNLQDLDSDYRIAAIEQDDGCIVSDDGLFIDNTFDSVQAQTTITTMLNLDSISGSNYEKPFMLFEAALTKTITSTDCNYGLIRPDAKLVFISMSDEIEQSDLGYAHYIPLLQGMKESPNDVVFHAIGGIYPIGCQTSDPYDGMFQAVSETGGVFLDICEIDWPTYFTQLAAGSVKDVRSFLLSSEFIVAPTIDVHINGVQTTESWVYNESTNNIVFDESYNPTEGDLIEIHYVPQVSCEM